MPADLHRSRVDFDLREDAAAQLFGRLYGRWAQAPAAFLDSSDHARTGTHVGSAPAGGAVQHGGHRAGTVQQAGVTRRNRYSILAFCLGAAGQVVQPDGDAWQWLADAWVFDRAATGSSGPETGSNLQFQRGQTEHGPPFQLGWVGFVGYENQGRFFRATHAVVVDHADRTAQLQAAGEDPDWEKVVRREIRQMAALADDPDDKAGTGPNDDDATGPSDEASTSDDDAAPPGPLAQLRVRDGRADYLAKIAAAQQQIRDGNSYEVCLTTAVTGAFTGSPWQAYLQLRAHNRAPFTQYLHLPGTEDDVVILSTSPERFMQITEAGTLRSEPIKGTRPRGADAEEDACLRQNLAEHPKDRAENVMITDLVRNDLSIHAVPGTLRTERLCAIETYPTVHQMVSTVSVQLEPDAAPTDALAAAFPPGSMTGAPKISTMEILNQLETGSRGPYSGVAGYFSTTGACDLSVLIRTATLTRPCRADAPWDFHLGLGGAITADSAPEEEWQEIITKSRGVLGALGAEFPDPQFP